MKWSPWPSGSTRRFRVKVNHLKLQGFNVEDGFRNRVALVEVKWKGPKPGGPGILVPFYGRSKRQRNYTSHRKLGKCDRIIEWDDEFQSLCNFGLKQGQGQSGCSFIPWDLCFTLLNGESAESRNLMAVMGRVSLNLAEMVSMMESQIQRKLAVPLKMEGMMPSEATLMVCLSFAEVRNSHDPAGIVPDSAESDKDRLVRGVNYFRSFRKANNERRGNGDRVTSSDTDESSCSDSEGSLWNEPISTGVHSNVELISMKSWLSRKRRWLNGRPPRRKVEPLIEKTSRGNAVQLSNDNHHSESIQKSDTVEYSSQSHYQHGNCITSSWEVKEVVSRDGQAKLKTNAFFASFDQLSEKAAGQSACTVLVAVIAHWLHSNRDSMPTRPQFDSLITQGSSEWQKLCSNDAYVNLFPNKHFDLETILEADLRPLAVLPEKSFIGFFSPEKFECLKGHMSFDEIWGEIGKHTKLYEPTIYIVSWNDHFFVLKVEADAYYIIDSLGQRLFEGCNQAYILRFDNSSVMYENAEKTEESQEEICRGKECCREFIRRFLAAIPVGELVEEEKKRTVPILPLHQRLQIEFHHTSSSCFSSSATSSTYSLFSNEE